MKSQHTIDSSSAEFFEHKYQQSADPWNFSSSAYEQLRYDVTMQALAGRHFRHAFEPGCSVGVLTERLAHICTRVTAVDLSPTAINAARSRCAGLPNVDLRVASFSDAIPEPAFDLVVLSEIGYYFDAPTLERHSNNVLQHLEPGGWLLAVHWLGYSKDHRLSGDEVHAVLASRDGITLQHSERHPGFLLDRWSKR